MRVLKHERSVAFDVDETLVMWEGQSYTPNQTNIDSLVRHAKRGHHVTVWSQGGWAWGLQIVKELGLEEYVDEVRTKFSWYCDDKPFDEFCDRYWYAGSSEEGDGKC